MNSELKKSKLWDILLFPAVLLWSVGVSSLMFWEKTGRYGATAFAGLYVFLFACATAYLAAKHKRFTQEAGLAGFACLLTASALLFCQDFFSNILLVFTLFWLSGSYCIKLCGANRYSPSSGYYIFDLLRCEIGISLVNVFVPYREVLPKKSGRKIGGAVIGVLVALPVLAAVAALLLSADSAFETVARKAFGGVFSGTGALKAAAAAVLTVFVFSAAYSFGNSLPQKSAEGKALLASCARKAPVSTVCGFLGCVSAVYALYLLSQTVYFFGAFTGKMPKGLEMTVAEYSRRGFFEMLAVAAINLALIGFAALLTKRAGREIPKSVKGISIFLCSFTVILILTVLSKMWLYIRSFGLTSSRITATAAAFVMLVSFIAVLLRLITVKFPYMRVIFASAVCFSLFFGFCNTERLIAEYNTGAYLSGKLKTVDIYQIETETGVMGLESLLKLTKCGDKSVAASARRCIERDFGIDGLYYSDSSFLKMENGRVVCEAAGGDIYTRLMLKKVNSHAEEYQKIYDKAMRPFETVYLYISAKDPVFRIGFVSYMIFSDYAEQLERFKLYEMKLSDISFAGDIDVDSSVGGNRMVRGCEKAGLLELCYDSANGYYLKPTGKPGISKEEAEKICRAAEKAYTSSAVK